MLSGGFGGRHSNLQTLQAGSAWFPPNLVLSTCRSSLARDAGTTTNLTRVHRRCQVIPRLTWRDNRVRDITVYHIPEIFRRWLKMVLQPASSGGGPISQALRSRERTKDIEKPQGRDRTATAAKGAERSGPSLSPISAPGPDLGKSNDEPEWQRPRYPVRMASRTFLESQGSRTRAGLDFCDIGSD